MKYFGILAAVLSVALVAGECLAQPPGDRPGARREGERGQRPEGQPGQRGQFPRGQRGEGERGGRFAAPDPKQMAKRFLEHDKDGDKKLDEQELTAAFEAMMQQRRQGGFRGQRGDAQGRPGEGRPGQGRRGQGEGDRPGRPRRPQNSDDQKDE